MDQEDEAEGSEMLDEYDFSAGVRGKYAEAYRQGIQIVVLDPERRDE